MTYTYPTRDEMHKLANRFERNMTRGIRQFLHAYYINVSEEQEDEEEEETALNCAIDDLMEATFYGD